MGNSEQLEKMNKSTELNTSPHNPLKGRFISNLLPLDFKTIAPLRGLGVIIAKN